MSENLLKRRSGDPEVFCKSAKYVIKDVNFVNNYSLNLSLTNSYVRIMTEENG